MNSYQKEIYSSYLAHAERRNHKYLYKMGDRYIYPEYVAKDAVGKAKKLSDAGQANNINMRKARAASTAAGNDRLAKNINNAGKTAKSKWESVDKDKLKELGKAMLPWRAKKMLEAGKEVQGTVKEKTEKYKSEQDVSKKASRELPEGYELRSDGRIYDSIGAIATQAEVDRALAAQKKKKTKTTAKK